MPLTFGEKVKIMLGRRKMTTAELAEKVGQSRQNMSNKMSRDNFTEKDMLEIAEALGCDFEFAFVMKDSGEKV